MGIEIRKGESIFYDFARTDSTALTADESATWEIRNASNVVVYSGSVTKNGNTLELRITGATTDGYTVGTYVLLVEFTNSDTGYADYIMDKSLKIIN